MSSTNIGYPQWTSSDHTFPPPPRYDSNGKKVPIWDAVEVDIREDEKNSLEKQPSWKSWISKPISWSSMRKKPVERESLWKPITLRFPVLGIIFATTVTMIIGLEVLSYLSIGKNNANGGGLAFAATADDISTVASFSYLYLPTVIAVFYSMIWSWVDLDTKRLEPWFQLSRRGGAVAENSLLLQYPFDFLAFVPVRAARRKHWAVVISGATMMLITWAIVPFQSAIFSTGTVIRTRDSPMITTGKIIAPDDQVTSLNSRFLGTAYGVSWLGQKLPPYTTKDYALLPFAPIDEDTQFQTSETWSATTQLYHTNLTCNPAIMTKDLPPDTWTFDNGIGCSVQLTLPRPDVNEYMILYVQYYDDAHADWALQNPNCTVDHSHNFLALWGINLPLVVDGIDWRKVGNLTALFCQPTYYVRTVTATVNASDHAVVGISYDTTLPPVTLSEDIFNVTNFEYVIGTGVTQRPVEGDIPDISLIEQYPRIFERRIQWPPSNMVGYGVAASAVEPVGLSDPLELHNAFEVAHKLLFSMAISALISPTTDNPTVVQRNGLRQDRPGGIIFVRTFSIIVEISLAAVGLMGCILWIYSQQRRSEILSDPASIADIMSLIHSNKKLSSEFGDNGTVTTEVLKERLEGHKFQLTASIQRSEMKLEALDQNKRGDSFASKKSIKTDIDCPGQYQGVRPFEMTFITGFVMVGVISTAIAVLIFLYDRTIRFNGIARPTDNQIVLSILENLIPTAFATLIEPFWVILNRLLCILQPFEDLRSGNAPPNATIEAKYTSLPPQLVVWRAIKSRHFLLATVCIVAISTNALAVALSGLFEESLTTTLIDISLKPTISSALNGIPDISRQAVDYVVLTYLDHYYISLANVSGSAPLPPWVDDTYFYQPVNLSAIATDGLLKGDVELNGYQALTRGFGVDVVCQQIFSDGDGDTFIFQPSQRLDDIEFSVLHKIGGGRNVTCDSQGSGNVDGRHFTMAVPSNGTNALETTIAMSLYNGTGISPDDGGYCDSLMVAGWVRLGPAVLNVGNTSTSTNGTSGRSLDTAFMTCSPSFKTAMFNITVGTKGRIISSQRTSDFDTNHEPYGSKEAIASLLSQITGMVTPYTPQRFKWHNDSFTTDWPNSYLKIKLNTSDLVDPNAPLPDIPTLIPQISALYKQLFGIILALNSGIFAEATADAATPGFIIITETRIFMSPVMFYISITLLVLQLVTAIAYYVKRPRKFLPRMPLTIASIIAYVSASHAVRDFDRSNSVAHDNAGHDLRYAYGRFKGIDGQTHVGIEKAPLVVPLKSKNPNVKRRRWLWKLRKNGKEPTIWI